MSYTDLGLGSRKGKSSCKTIGHMHLHIEVNSACVKGAVDPTRLLKEILPLDITLPDMNPNLSLF